MANVTLVDAKGNAKKGAGLGSKPACLISLFSYSGIKGQTLWSMQQEMRSFDKYGVNFLFLSIDDDALISRSRSKVLSAFVQNEKVDVCLMVDHDMEWEPGELLALAIKAHERKTCVSGIYSARAIGRGMSSRPKDQMVVAKAMTDQLIEAEYLAGGFLAIPKVVALEVLKAGEQACNDLVNVDHVAAALDSARLANQALHSCAYNEGPPVYDFFRPICVERTFQKAGLPSLKEAPFEYLSEDWAFSWRCRAANPDRPLYLWSFPWLKHYGDFPYTMKTAFMENKVVTVTESDGGEGTKMVKPDPNAPLVVP